MQGATQLYLIALIYINDPANNRGAGLFTDRATCGTAAINLERNTGNESRAYCIPITCFDAKTKRALDRPDKRKYVLSCGALMLKPKKSASKF